MSRKHYAHPRPTQHRTSGRRWVAPALLVGAVAAVGGTMLLIQTLAAPSTGSASPGTQAHLKGAASAPVTIVEWGDFQ